MTVTPDAARSRYPALYEYLTRGPRFGFGRMPARPRPPSPLARARQRWTAARALVAAANRGRSTGLRSVAMRELNAARAHYRRTITAAEGWLEYRRLRRENPQ